jgi:hypothetical protein
MSNLENSAKSKGVILFAFNTDLVDYVKIADQTSRLIQHHLDLPITLVTDGNPTFAYDKVIHIDQEDGNFRINDDLQEVPWRNFGRHRAYELSPYDETILLDTDYLVMDNSLLTLLETNYDYKLQHNNTTPKGKSYQLMGGASLPYIWATTVLFRKTNLSEMLFDLVGRIQRNYAYYRVLYNIREGNFRNDYAFAIANCMLSGYSLNESKGIPWSMFTLDNKISDIRIVNDSLYVYTDDTPLVIPKQNIHLMDKEYLQSENFNKFVEALI